MFFILLSKWDSQFHWCSLIIIIPASYTNVPPFVSAPITATNLGFLVTSSEPRSKLCEVWSSISPMVTTMNIVMICHDIDPNWLVVNIGQISFKYWSNVGQSFIIIRIQLRMTPAAEIHTSSGCTLAKHNWTGHLDDSTNPWPPSRAMGWPPASPVHHRSCPWPQRGLHVTSRRPASSRRQCRLWDYLRKKRLAAWNLLETKQPNS